MIKLEVGKFYEDGHGQIIEIIYERHNKFIGMATEENGEPGFSDVYTLTGEAPNSHNYEDNLVKEWQEPGQLESNTLQLQLQTEQHKFTILDSCIGYMQQQIDALREQIFALKDLKLTIREEYEALHEKQRDEVICNNKRVVEVEGFVVCRHNDLASLNDCLYRLTGLANIVYFSESIEDAERFIKMENASNKDWSALKIHEIKNRCESEEV